MLGGGCKRRLPPALIVGPDGSRVRVRAVLHPRGCMGARFTHVDVELGSDPCGLRVVLGRGGHRVRARVSAGETVVDLSGILGYTCVVYVPYELGGVVYVMVSRGGRLYVAPASGRRGGVSRRTVRG